MNRFLQPLLPTGGVLCVHGISGVKSFVINVFARCKKMDTIDASESWRCLVRLVGSCLPDVQLPGLMPQNQT